MRRRPNTTLTESSWCSPVESTEGPKQGIGAPILAVGLGPPAFAGNSSWLIRAVNSVDPIPLTLDTTCGLTAPVT